MRHKPYRDTTIHPSSAGRGGVFYERINSIVNELLIFRQKDVNVMLAVVILFLIIVSAAALAAGLSPAGESLLTIINRSFLAGLSLLVLGCISLVVRSGFFTVFGAGFKRLKTFFFRRPRVLESDWHNMVDTVFAPKKETFFRIGTSLLLWSGAALIVFSVAMLVWHFR